ncbi:MAG: bifunctional folylpolyglutamate synthase/dihydrofolate synthase [Actinobacteria bacterium]|nr:bifunctional folylpolyglutamate synthase/dihydrofolate synthase [Actinomycetota bacterium]
MDLTAARRYLDSHINLEATAGWVHGLSLDKMRRLAHVLGDPHQAYPVVHLTGTNGKGSTARMVTELLRAAGLSVGTYTSPHLERLNERLAWDGQPISDDDLADAIGSVAMIEDMAGVTPSYFEILTAAALRWFADVAVDVAVVEVGLLGRYDATNIVDAAVAVVTNVGADHTDRRGDWRHAIASEKAGIIKPGSHLVLGETSPPLRDVFLAEGPARAWVRDEDFGCTANRLAFGGRLVDLRTPGAEHEDVFLPVHGAHQGDNAACAMAAAEAFLGAPLSEVVVSEAFGGLTLPGRFEVVDREPTIVIDGAHNPDGAAAAAATLTEEFTLSGSVVLVVGMLQGRDPVEVLELLGARDAGFVVTCTPPSPRAIPAPEVAAAADKLGAVAEAVPSVLDAIDRARALASSDDLILVTGSLYVVGEARAHLLDHHTGEA